MKKLLVILAIFTTTQASAGILLEPYLGYHMGTGEQSGNGESDVTGMGFGARLGWTLPLVFIALDYSSGGLEAEGGGSTSDLDYTAMGVVVGASLPMIRVWAGYNLSAEADVEGFVMEGSGMKAGLGFKMPALPISFNLEYIMNEYDEVAGATLSPKYEHTSLFFSVSAPLDF